LNVDADPVHVFQPFAVEAFSGILVWHEALDEVTEPGIWCDRAGPAEFEHACHSLGMVEMFFDSDDSHRSFLR
jgi:hypothetical protein